EQRERDKAKGNYAVAMQKLGGTIRRGTLDPEGAMTWLTRAEALQREVLEAPTTGEIPQAEAQQSLANSLFEIAEVHKLRQDYGRALAAAREALRLREAVAKARPTPNTRDAQSLLAEAYLQVGVFEAKLKKDAEAEAAFTEGVAVYRELLRQDPGNVALL